MTPFRIAAFLLALGAIADPAGAAPAPEVWERWTRHDAGSTGTIDHSAWDAFLKRHVSADATGLHRVAYGRVTAEDREALRAYLGRLQDVPISRYGRAEQRAYWINLYNALTVDVVLDHYPVNSIRDIDISPGLFSVGPWGAPLARVEGVQVTLDDVEHRILRPIWKDPRIHYAVNCASIGCPNLARDAYTAANTDALLDAGARAYVNSVRGFQVEDGRVTASSIYDWFQVDFGGSQQGVLDHARRYAEPGLAVALDRARDIDGYRYDWRLNEPR